MENKSKSEQRQSVLQLKKGRVKGIAETLQLSIGTPSRVKLPKIIVTNEEDKEKNKNCEKNRAALVEELKILNNKHSPRKENQDDSDKEVVDPAEELEKTSDPKDFYVTPGAIKLPKIIVTDEEDKEKNKNYEKNKDVVVEELFKIITNNHSCRKENQDDSEEEVVDSGEEFEETSDPKDFYVDVASEDRGINEEFKSKTNLHSRSKVYFKIFENQEDEDNEEGASNCFNFNESSPQSTIINNIIQELISLEKKCLCGLRIVIEDFVPEDNVQSSHIFENIQAMYEHMDKFIASLTENSKDADRIAHVFINEELTFKKVYPIYAKNVAILKSDDNINGSLSDLLCGPINRLAHRFLILTRIKEELNKSSCSTRSVEFAIEIINEVRRQSDDILHIINVHNMDLSTKGSFIMNQKFWITKPKKFQSMVFLFEDEIIITQKNDDRFNYFDSIKLQNLGLEKFFGSEDNKFYLKDYSKLDSKQSDTYVLEAEDRTIRSEWTTKLQEILYKQAEQIKRDNRNANTETNNIHSKIKKDAKKHDYQKSKFYI